MLRAQSMDGLADSDFFESTLAAEIERLQEEEAALAAAGYHDGHHHDGGGCRRWLVASGLQHLQRC